MRWGNWRITASNHKRTKKIVETWATPSNKARNIFPISPKWSPISLRKALSNLHNLLLTLFHPTVRHFFHSFYHSSVALRKCSSQSRTPLPLRALFSGPKLGIPRFVISNPWNFNHQSKKHPELSDQQLAKSSRLTTRRKTPTHHDLQRQTYSAPCFRYAFLISIWRHCLPANIRVEKPQQQPQTSNHYAKTKNCAIVALGTFRLPSSAVRLIASNVWAMMSVISFQMAGMSLGVRLDMRCFI